MADRLVDAGKRSIRKRVGAEHEADAARRGVRQRVMSNRREIRRYAAAVRVDEALTISGQYSVYAMPKIYVVYMAA